MSQQSPSNAEKMAAGSPAHREVTLHQKLIKVAQVSQNMIDAFRIDRDSAAKVADDIVQLGKEAGLIAASDEKAVRAELSTHAGTMKVAQQILEETVAAQKKVAQVRESGPNNFSTNGRTGRPMRKTASASNAYEDRDVISDAASRLR